MFKIFVIQIYKKWLFSIFNGKINYCLIAFVNVWDFKMTLGVFDPLAHPVISEAWTGFSQLCPESGGSP